MDDYRTCVRHSASWQVWKVSPPRRTTLEDWTIISPRIRSGARTSRISHFHFRRSDFLETFEQEAGLRLEGGVLPPGMGSAQSLWGQVL